jgi:hypothetical protein
MSISEDGTSAAVALYLRELATLRFLKRVEAIKSVRKGKKALLLVASRTTKVGGRACVSRNSRVVK